MTDRLRQAIAAAAVLLAGLALWRRRPVRNPDTPGCWEPLTRPAGNDGS